MSDDFTNSTETSSVHWGRHVAYHGPMHWDQLGPRWSEADPLEGQRDVNNNWTSLPTSLLSSQGLVCLWFRRARGRCSCCIAALPRLPQPTPNADILSLVPTFLIFKNANAGSFTISTKMLISENTTVVA